MEMGRGGGQDSGTGGRINRTTGLGVGRRTDRSPENPGSKQGLLSVGHPAPRPAPPSRRTNPCVFAPICPILVGGRGCHLSGLLKPHWHPQRPPVKDLKKEPDRYVLTLGSSAKCLVLDRVPSMPHGMSGTCCHNTAGHPRKRRGHPGHTACRSLPRDLGLST